MNRGGNNFDDVTYSAGLGRIKNCLGWGVQFYDFDNSGWPGILIANGQVYPEVDGKALDTSFREPKLAYYNLRDGTFANITGEAGSVLSELRSGRASGHGSNADRNADSSVALCRVAGGDEGNRHKQDCDSHPVVDHGAATRALPFAGYCTPEQSSDDVDGHENGPAHDCAKRAQ